MPPSMLIQAMSTVGRTTTENSRPRTPDGPRANLPQTSDEDDPGGKPPYRGKRDLSGFNICLSPDVDNPAQPEGRA